ncbi:MAG TPA: uroporphyrinogen decarboxylase family protein [Phycisphaerae bacterium]|nr:uroporphyrinogen decarboxylase family protein [Phycisphaerae bacterium]HOJ72832.1 uroporphyrinogen decarboxylase family protein [Phycisphaerae bacterium]HOM51741.1 uroporphyrinogen decarboxylase family protein [Phycisphaerae bacterium]HON64991.1 uroporphyrinogen decarboxylase family protein [Phycisphaerae bacterium]HOQ87484.1 uroporphyrinogen decarboxylase family protein [Phycisphaerae bacterium]
MTSRERVLAAIAHTEPDRLPVDCGAMRSTGIQAIAYRRMADYLGVKDARVRVFDVIQQLAEPEAWYLDGFGIDAINAGREFPHVGWKPWVLPDGSPCEIPASMDFRREGDDWVAYGKNGEPQARMIAGATYFSQAVWPLAGDDWKDELARLPEHMGKVDWAGLAEPLYDGGLSDENLQRIAAHVKQLRATSDRAIMIAFGGNLFEWGTFLRRMDNFLMDLAADPAGAEALLDKLVEIHLANLDKLIPVLGDNVDLIQLGDDLGTENGPFFSPEMYRRMFKPRHKAIIDRIKQLNPNLKVFLHCCGGVYELLPDLIEAGVEVINPVQISARHMEPERLKKEFGRDITFWGGGCDTQSVLCRGTPQQVRDHVRRNIEIFAPGGGFIFNPVHNILSEVPPANVVAMYEACRA